MSYTLINNDGKSNYLLFTVVDNRDVPENKPKRFGLRKKKFNYYSLWK